MLAVGCVVGATSVARAGIGCVNLMSERLPQLLERATQGDGASAEFRDELIALARESSDVAVRELRRGLYDLDTFTRPEGEAPASRERPYRTKP